MHLSEEEQKIEFRQQGARDKDQIQCYINLDVSQIIGQRQLEVMVHKKLHQNLGKIILH